MIFNELEARGLVKQTTHTEKIRDMLNNQSVTFYIGFDPTADSLHVGHLLQLVTARRLVRAGHKAILLIGGATATVGDPTGKSEARKQLSLVNTHINGNKIESQIKNLLPEGQIVNNMSWFDGLSFLSFLRDIAPHFSVNNMLRAESVKSRLENGLSFLEFNYMIMQATDFLWLHKAENCMLQIGGDDQWSNILAGIDLVHKVHHKEVFGLTFPLLVNSDGTKMGKTEKGAVWLDSNKTSPFEFFQFWRNIPDGMVGQCFKFFTDLSVEEIEALPIQSFHADVSPVSEINTAKRKLAFEVTKLVHGQEAAEQALNQAESLFEGQDASKLEAVSIQEGVHVLDLVVKGGFAKSRTEARNLINGRGISINNNVLTDPTIQITRGTFGSDLVVRKGKKHFCRFLLEDKCQDPIS